MSVSSLLFCVTFFSLTHTPPPPDDGANKSVEGTECSRIQIANGDIARELPIPIYFVFPRLYTAPSFNHRMFTVDFDICIQVILESGLVVSETFPLTLIRN